MSKQPKLTKAQFRMDRRQLLSGLTSSGLILSGVHHAFGQTRVPVTGGEVAPLPIAIPNFVAGKPPQAQSPPAAGRGPAPNTTHRRACTPPPPSPPPTHS